MTSAAVVIPIERAKGSRRPVHITVKRSELVESLLDHIALAEEAVDANGAALGLVLRLPAGPWRDELQTAHHFAHERLSRLLADLRMQAGRLDGNTPAIPTT